MSSDLKASLNTAQFNSPRIRLEFLDGIRGLAALYVVLGHAIAIVFWGAAPNEASHAIVTLASWLIYGHYSVVFFIVISGFCLMLPVTRTADGSVPGGGIHFIKRRAHRILPPYYAALVLSFILIVAVPGLHHFNHVRWDGSLPAFTPGVIISHLLLIHNLRPQWSPKINNPMWSIGTEWQIYFLFPTLLLPLWRRFGNIPLFFVAYIAGIALYYLSHKQLSCACPWLLGMFALGMIGADICFSARPFQQSLREKMPWNWLTLTLTSLVIIIHVAAPRLAVLAIPMDALAGCAGTCFIIANVLRVHQPTRPLYLRILENKPILALGSFSYSLYLIHDVILSAIYSVLHSHHVSLNLSFLILFTIGIPAVVFAAYLFFLLFERPFLNYQKESAKKPRLAAASELNG